MIEQTSDSDSDFVMANLAAENGAKTEAHLSNDKNISQSALADELSMPGQPPISIDLSQQPDSNKNGESPRKFFDTVVNEFPSNITEPTEMLRYLQKKIVRGRPLEVTDPSMDLQGETNFITVDREKILQTTFEELKSVDDPRVTFEVQFYGEQAVDSGGPRREWIRLCNQQIKVKYFDNGIKEHLLEDYFYVGQMVSIALLQNGQLPVYIPEDILQAIFVGKCEQLSPCMRVCKMADNIMRVCKMADNIKTACSSAFQKSREINCVVDPESVKSVLLCVQDDDLLWKGDLESLKAFVETNLQLNGRWSSSCGESIQFSNPEFCIKWNGSTDKKLVILQDNDESQLFKTLQSYANNTDGANHGNEKKSSKQTPSKHMVQDGATETKSKQSACQNCNSLSDEISKIMDMVNELKNQHEDERRNTKAREAESNEKIQYLIDDRKKMSHLATVTELTHENSAIKTFWI